MARFVKVVGVVLGLILILAMGALGSIGFWLSPQSSLTHTDAIVAISGGDTAARTREAIRLYREGWAPNLIFSGAALDPNGPSNAEAMRRQALADGVPASAILIDEASANTEQNAEDVAQIMAQNHFHKLILVTSPYHQRRADLTFKRTLGPTITILNHSTVDQEWRRSAWWATAYSRHLTWSELRKTVYVAFFQRRS